MKQKTKETIEFFATTITEAEGLVLEMKSKHLNAIVNHSVTRKDKKGFEYFVIKVTIQHVTVKELLEELV